LKTPTLRAVKLGVAGPGMQLSHAFAEAVTTAATSRVIAHIALEPRRSA
jgi:hypothetical protein